MFKPTHFRFLLPQRCLRTPIIPNIIHHRRYVQPPSKPPPETNEPSESAQISPIQDGYLQQEPNSTRRSLPHPIFSRAPSERLFLPSVQTEDSNAFHPAAAGFLAGIVVAFSLSYVIYFFSGTFYIKKGWDRDFKKLNETKNHINGLPDPKRVWKKEDNPYIVLGEEEKLEWLKKIVDLFSPFMPNSEIFVRMRWAEVENVLRDGGEDARKQASAIVDECAAELKKEVNESAVGVYIGRVGWGIVRKHLDRIADMGKTEEMLALEKKRKGGPK